MPGDRPADPQFGGRPYIVDKRAGYQPGTVTEVWEGIGLVGSTRAWRGTHWSQGVKWWAARNASGAPGRATACSEGFATRKAAVTWLLSQSGTTS